MANRLQNEPSLYLRQHQNHPVDWYPWGEEALDKAQAENKPILLSIGYAACHWCHVMAQECFEDPKIAAAMNRLFVNIKVDREERPDLDAVYMEAVVALSGQGGWPLTVFLTPEGVPFYGGTYFPPTRRYGRPGFLTVIKEVEEFYRRNRKVIERDSAELMAEIKKEFRNTLQGRLERGLLDTVAGKLKEIEDPFHGGFDGAPKFPLPLTLEFLIRNYLRTGHSGDRQCILLSLDHMRWGGLYDHVGGGFHRYATDRRWQLPHFEKMLYDNAMLARLYLLGYQVFGELRYREVAENTLDWVIHEFQGPEGGFASSLDADSEGEEGRYYRWSRAEIDKALPEESGFWDSYELIEGVLNQRKDRPELPDLLAVLREKRQSRIAPAREDRAIASWNGLMLRTLCDAAKVLGREDYQQAAIHLGEFLLTLWQPPRLLRTSVRQDIVGFLEDYANVADGLLALYELTFEGHWLEKAGAIADALIDQFWDAQEATFHDSGSQNPALLITPRQLSDQGVPSGISSACRVLLKLGHYLAPHYSQAVPLALKNIEGFLTNDPVNFGGLLLAIDEALEEFQEVALIGLPQDSTRLEMMRLLREKYRPYTLLAASDGNSSPVQFLQGKAMDTQTTAYVCQNQVCGIPISDARTLKRILG